MSRVACVWADLGDTTAAADFEDDHVPNVVAQLKCTARHSEKEEENIFKEVAAIRGNTMTVYDLPDGADAKDFGARIQPAADKLPKDAWLETRMYKERNVWHGEDWREGKPALPATLIALKKLTVSSAQSWATLRCLWSCFGSRTRPYMMSFSNGLLANLSPALLKAQRRFALG